MTLVETATAASPNHIWLLTTAAVIMVISLTEAWIVSLIYYLRVGFLRSMFPSPHQLIRSHVDYLIMAALLGFFYISTQAVGITLPNIILVLICLGALYNPFPFIFMAMQADVGAARKNMSRTTGLVICIGFLPVTIGFGYTAIAVLSKILL